MLFCVKNFVLNSLKNLKESKFAPLHLYKIMRDYETSFNALEFSFLRSRVKQMNDVMRNVSSERAALIFQLIM